MFFVSAPPKARQGALDMTRFLVAAYALATAVAWTTAPIEPPPEVSVTVVAEAATEEAASEAAWAQAETALDERCHHYRMHADPITTGVEAASPVDGGIRVEVFTGTTCG
jgi:hypothetical protein